MRDDIEIETVYGQTIAGTGGYSATINDRKAGRAWSGEGVTAGAAATEAVKKFLGDRRAKEYVGD